METNKIVNVHNEISDSKLFCKINTENSVLEYEELNSRSYKITTSPIRSIECKLEYGFFEYEYIVEFSPSLINIFVALNQGKPIVYINDFMLSPNDSRLIIFRKIVDFIRSKLYR